MYTPSDFKLMRRICPDEMNTLLNNLGIKIPDFDAKDEVEIYSELDAAIDKKINTAIIAEVDRFLTGVYRNAQTNGYTVADVRTSYEVGSNETGNTVILSIILTESNYYKGGAHPATYKHALNFNVSNGDLMDISYLTDVGSGNPQFSLENVSKKLREHAERNKIYLFDDALPLKKLPEDFYWDENLHVHLIFQHYEVAPYAAGIIDVDMD